MEYTGGVPYSILKPVLERATPGQLFNVENHNPDLIGDTDELWGLHCKKLFKGQRPQEMESWRDMYLRCCDEREAKLRSLTQNIKQSQEKSLPVRQTKLAYVDTFVKPPRAVARKQVRICYVRRATKMHQHLRKSHECIVEISRWYVFLVRWKILEDVYFRQNTVLPQIINRWWRRRLDWKTSLLRNRPTPSPCRIPPRNERHRRRVLERRERSAACSLTFVIFFFRRYDETEKGTVDAESTGRDKEQI